MFRTRTSYSPIGLDIGPRSVRAAQIRLERRAGKTVRTLAAASRLCRRAETDDEGNPSISVESTIGLVQTLERQGFIGDRVTLAMSQRRLLSGVLEVPSRSSGAPLDVICRNELARSHRLEPEQVEAGWWELPPPPAGTAGSREVSGGTQVMAVGCRVADAEAWIDAFEAAGVEVCAIEARGPVLARAAAPRILASPALTAVLDWDTESALILIVRAGVIVYERHLPEAGLAAVEAELVKKMGTDADAALHIIEHVGLAPATGELADDAEHVGHAQRIIGERIDTLALEVLASASYAGRRFGDSVGRLIVCGEGAAMPEAVARLERRVEMPTEEATLERLFPEMPGSGVRAGIGSGGSSLAAAIGLASAEAEARA